MGITFFRCPHCDVSIGTRSGLRNDLDDIGPPMMQCSKCGHLIRTGAQEWIDMPLSGKLKIWAEVYLYYGVLIGPLFGVIAWAGVTAGLHQSQGLGCLAAIVVWGLVMRRVHCVHKSEVRESLKRKLQPDNGNSPTG
jgi:hypothetical protein